MNWTIQKNLNHYQLYNENNIPLASFRFSGKTFSAKDPLGNRMVTITRTAADKLSSPDIVTGNIHIVTENNTSAFFPPKAISAEFKINDLHYRIIQHPNRTFSILRENINLSVGIFQELLTTNELYKRRIEIDSSFMIEPSMLALFFGICLFLFHDDDIEII